MKVYIRDEREANGVYFCEWSPDRMEELVDILRHGGGVYIEDHENELSYQFILERGRAGAEIIVHAEGP